MIPLRDNQPTNSFPIVTVLLIVANALVFVAQLLSGGMIDSSYSMVPAEVVSGRDLAHVIGQIGRDGSVHLLQIPPNVHDIRLGPDELYYGPSPHPLWLTIFSSMFMHSGWLHIGGNMLYLWIFGNNIEDALGKVRYLVFYLVCGVIAALAQIATNPASLIPTLGASGAIAGVLGAYLLLYPNARVLSIIPVFGFGVIREINALWVLGLWIALQLFQGFRGIGMEHGGGVAYFAHIGGFFAGLLIIQLLGGKRLAMRQQRRALDPPPGGGPY